MTVKQYSFCLHISSPFWKLTLQSASCLVYWARHKYTVCDETVELWNRSAAKQSVKPSKKRQRNVSCDAFSPKFMQICSQIGLVNTLACRSMNISHLEIGEKPGIFRLTYQLHSSSVDYARKLFKPSKDLASVQVCNEKKFVVLGFGFVVSDVI